MLITFSCKVYENITMFGDVAKKLLTIMNHSGTVPGALAADDIPDALLRLEKSMQQEKQNMPPSTENGEPQVSLALRAIPLINMLKAAKKHHCAIMWDNK